MQPDEVDDDSHASASEKETDDQFRLLPVSHKDDTSVSRCPVSASGQDAELRRRWAKTARRWSTMKTRSVVPLRRPLDLEADHLRSSLIWSFTLILSKMPRRTVSSHQSRQRRQTSGKSRKVCVLTEMEMLIIEVDLGFQISPGQRRGDHYGP